MGDEDAVFELGLDDEHTIKRGSVMQGKRCHRDHMTRGNGEHGALHATHSFDYFLIERFRESQFIQLHFDSHLPDTRIAEKELIGFVVQSGASSG
ncbi:MAG: hypothetical protein FWD61_14685 [Phycisphaerales bacterium]|nr:hypothetical protein [Phycisphaerales bacterium]